MNTKQVLLDMLVEADGSFVSGAFISAKLGLSRSAVWKQVKNLREEGYQIDSLPRVGYRLLSLPDRLYPLEIKRILKARSLGSEILYFDRLGSTNDEAMELASSGASEGTVVIAEEQTKGKGRLGRGWISPKGQGIWFSTVLRPDALPSETALITLMAAVAVAKAIEAGTGLKVEIKWPNDILIKGKKVAGILTEMSAELDKVHYIVVGIGINVNIESGSFPEELRETATSLKKETGKKVDRVKLFCAVLEELERFYQHYQAGNRGEILAGWKEYSSTIGKRVKAMVGNEVIESVVEGVDDKGRLLLRLSDGSLHQLTAGEVTYLR